MFGESAFQSGLLGQRGFGRKKRCKRGNWASPEKELRKSLEVSKSSQPPCMPSEDRVWWEEARLLGGLLAIPDWVPLKMKVKLLSHVRLSVSPWTGYIAHQAPLSMGFSRQEYWSGVAMSFSRGSSRPRDRTQVSCTAGRLFTL